MFAWLTRTFFFLVALLVMICISSITAKHKLSKVLLISISLMFNALMWKQDTVEDDGGERRISGLQSETVLNLTPRTPG